MSNYVLSTWPTIKWKVNFFCTATRYRMRVCVNKLFFRWLSWKSKAELSSYVRYESLTEFHSGQATANELDWMTKLISHFDLWRERKARKNESLIQQSRNQLRRDSWMFHLFYNSICGRVAIVTIPSRWKKGWVSCCVFSVRTVQTVSRQSWLVRNKLNLDDE